MAPGGKRWDYALTLEVLVPELLELVCRRTHMHNVPDIKNKSRSFTSASVLESSGATQSTLKPS